MILQPVVCYQVVNMSYQGPNLGVCHTDKAGRWHRRDRRCVQCVVMHRILNPRRDPVTAHALNCVQLREMNADSEKIRCRNDGIDGDVWDMLLGARAYIPKYISILIWMWLYACVCICVCVCVCIYVCVCVCVYIHVCVRAWGGADLRLCAVTKIANLAEPVRVLTSSTHVRSYQQVQGHTQQVARVARSPALAQSRISDSRTAWQIFKWKLEVDGRLAAVNKCDIKFLSLPPVCVCVCIYVCVRVCAFMCVCVREVGQTCVCVQWQR